jgi:hypothetical protein
VSQEETYRSTITVQTPDKGKATVIVTRRSTSAGARIWITFDGAIKTTAVFTKIEAAHLGELIDTARETP